MMDQIIITFVLISLFCKASGQLRCLVCTNCPNLDELDYSFSQQCNIVSPPNTQPTSNSTLTTIDESSSPTQPTSTTTPTTTVTENTPPNTPPTSTTTPTTTIENSSPTPPTPTTTPPITSCMIYYSINNIDCYLLEMAKVCIHLGVGEYE